MYVGTGFGTGSQIGPGGDTSVLVADSTQAVGLRWGTSSSVVASGFGSAGQIPYGTGLGTGTLLNAGGAGTVLTSSGTAPSGRALILLSSRRLGRRVSSITARDLELGPNSALAVLGPSSPLQDGPPVDGRLSRCRGLIWGGGSALLRHGIWHGNYSWHWWCWDRLDVHWIDASVVSPQYGGTRSCWWSDGVVHIGCAVGLGSFERPGHFEER